MKNKTTKRERLRRFRAFSYKHTTLLALLPAIVIWCILTALTLGDRVAPAYTGAAATAALFLCALALKRYHAKYWAAAQRELYHNCDPHPTLSELALYIECAGRKRRATGLKVTFSTALALAGKYSDAEATLSALDSGEDGELPTEARAVINYNFAALYCAMNMRENAKEKYDLAKELFLASPASFSDKMPFNGTTDAEIECYKGNGERALKILSMIEPDNRFQEVVKKFSLAKVHYILGEKDAALSEFEWVAKNGNRLACAGEAQAIVDTINLNK
ncbi:MAG: hypothetical protein IJQ80_08025 [Clostridia bacterium]|nr:hypothetical protein [Clostridia bacterium]